MEKRPIAYDGAILNGAGEGAVGLGLERDERGADELKQGHELAAGARREVRKGGRRRRRRLAVGLGPHQGTEVLPPEQGVGAHVGEHLLRNRDLQHRVEPVLLVQVRAQFPHQDRGLLVHNKSGNRDGSRSWGNGNAIGRS